MGLRHQFGKKIAIGAALAAAALIGGSQLVASEAEVAVVRDYSLVRAAPAPRTQDWPEAEAKSAGCQSCHTESDGHTMHRSPAVILGCTDCHGGNPQVRGDPALAPNDPTYVAARDAAHVLPRYPESWHFPVSANPRRSYTLLNREAPEYVRFINPSDYRVVRDSCGACHIEIIEAAERSIMSTGAMLWGGGAYNNGILPFKNYLLGEAYTREGLPARIQSPINGQITQEQRARGVLAELYPLPTWHVDRGDIFGCSSAAAATSAAASGNQASPTRPARSSGSRAGPTRHPPVNRGPGTGLRVSIRCSTSQDAPQRPVHVVHGHQRPAGRLSPFGCSGCHVVYAMTASRGTADLRPIWPRRADRDGRPDHPRSDRACRRAWRRGRGRSWRGARQRRPPG